MAWPSSSSTIRPSTRSTSRFGQPSPRRSTGARGRRGGRGRRDHGHGAHVRRRRGYPGAGAGGMGPRGRAAGLPRPPAARRGLPQAHRDGGERHGARGRPGARHGGPLSSRGPHRPPRNARGQSRDHPGRGGNATTDSARRSGEGARDVRVGEADRCRGRGPFRAGGPRHRGRLPGRRLGLRARRGAARYTSPPHARAHGQAGRPRRPRRPPRRRPRESAEDPPPPDRAPRGRRGDRGRGHVAFRRGLPPRAGALACERAIRASARHGPRLLRRTGCGAGARRPRPASRRPRFTRSRWSARERWAPASRWRARMPGSR